MELGKPTFVPVQDLEMGFEKIVKIAHARGGISLVSKAHVSFLFSSSSLTQCSIVQCARSRM